MAERARSGVATRICHLVGGVLVVFNVMVFSGLTITALSGPADDYPFAVLFFVLGAIGPVVVLRRWRRAGETAVFGEALCSLTPWELLLAVVGFLILAL